ncbi:MAG: CHAP domain-containing protein, partial [Clostridia bacterium]|nr:CHAP domain-containing protein [Clostridia bacterium]
MKRFQSALAIVIALLLALSAMPVLALQESIGKTMSGRDSCEGSTREAPDTGTRTQSHYQNFSSNYVLTGNGASDMVAVALAQEGMSGSQLGYTEDWCADFVGDCAILAHQSAAVPLYGGVPGLRTRLINAGGTYVSVATAQPGDLCIIDWNGNGNNNHIEIVYSANGSSISTIGGNTGNGTISTRTVKKHNPLSNSVITCIIRPNYSYNPISIPAAPQNIRLDKSLYSTTEYIHLAWDASAGATDYYVYLWNDDIGVELYGIDNGTNLSFTQAPLGVGNYTFIVRAGNSAGYSNSDAYVRFKVYDRIPDSPKNLRTSNGSTLFSFTESITFLWDASELATDYYVYLWNDDIGVELYGIDNGTNLSFTQAPLGVGNYTFIVRAGNSAGYSNSDAYVRFKVYDRIPDSPKNLR